LFGHEKGSFTGATDARKGYFEEANGGTIFLDEVAELPALTQVRLLRVLETGEYIRVGSSKVQKTNVRVVAATNVDFSSAIHKGKFREDLYYRLNQVPIFLPPLRERREDIPMLFAKFTTDFSEKYKMPVLELTPEARELLVNYSWPGNIRQLKNITEQINVLEQDRLITAETLRYYLPHEGFGSSSLVPISSANANDGSQNFSEREILYKVLFDMKNDLNDLKQLVSGMMQSGNEFLHDDSNAALVQRVFSDNNVQHTSHGQPVSSSVIRLPQSGMGQPSNQHHIDVEESLSLQSSEKDLIVRALKKHRNKRKYAAEELGISERTLYRKIKEYNIAK